MVFVFSERDFRGTRNAFVLSTGWAVSRIYLVNKGLGVSQAWQSGTWIERQKQLPFPETHFSNVIIAIYFIGLHMTHHH